MGKGRDMWPAVALGAGCLLLIIGSVSLIVGAIAYERYHRLEDEATHEMCTIDSFNYTACKYCGQRIGASGYGGGPNFDAWGGGPGNTQPSAAGGRWGGGAAQQGTTQYGGYSDNYHGTNPAFNNNWRRRNYYDDDDDGCFVADGVEILAYITSARCTMPVIQERSLVDNDWCGKGPEFKLGTQTNECYVWNDCSKWSSGGPYNYYEKGITFLSIFGVLYAFGLIGCIYGYNNMVRGRGTDPDAQKQAASGLDQTEQSSATKSWTLGWWVARGASIIFIGLTLFSVSVAIAVCARNDSLWDRAENREFVLQTRWESIGLFRSVVNINYNNTNGTTDLQSPRNPNRPNLGYGTWTSTEKTLDDLVLGNCKDREIAFRVLRSFLILAAVIKVASLGLIVKAYDQPCSDQWKIRKTVAHYFLYCRIATLLFEGAVSCCLATLHQRSYCGGSLDEILELAYGSLFLFCNFPIEFGIVVYAAWLAFKKLPEIKDVFGHVPDLAEGPGQGVEATEHGYLPRDEVNAAGGIVGYEGAEGAVEGEEPGQPYGGEADADKA